MPIASGLLDQRVTVRTVNPLANPTKDKIGKLIPVEGELLYRDTRRWAQVRSIDLSDQPTPGAVVADGQFIIVMRRDSFTRQIKVGDKIQWDGDWFAVTNREPNIFNDTIEFSSVPSDDAPREEYDPRGGVLETEDGRELFTEDDQNLVPEFA